MDLSKYPVDKLFHFAAGIIPGFIALLIFQIAHPGVFSWFFALGFFGYKTTLTLIVLTCFLVGNSFTTFLSAFLGGLGGMLGAISAQKPYKPSHTYLVAPWRDPLWRTALKTFLGTNAPKDTQLMSPETFDLRRQMLEQFPNIQEPMALSELGLEKLNLEIEDGRWERWYDHYHRIVLLSANRDFLFHVRTGFNFSMEAAGLYVVIGSLLVPAVRHWWALIPASGWVLLGVAEVYAQLRNFSNKWSTLSDQIEYLSNPRPGPDGLKSKGASQ